MYFHIKQRFKELFLGEQENKKGTRGFMSSSSFNFKIGHKLL